MIGARRRKPKRRITALMADGRVLAYVHTAGGPLTDHDRAVLTRTHRILTDQYRNDQEETQRMSDQNSDQAPGEVDLTTAGVAGWVFVLRQIKQQKAALDEAEANARAHIEKALGNAVDGTIDGRPVVRWNHTAPPRQFNKKQFAKDHPALLGQYTTFGAPGRRFELVQPKDDA